MNVSVPTGGVIIRTGVERATLVRRTYTVVFASVLVTALGVRIALGIPALLEMVIRHPWLSLIAAFVPLIAAGRFQRAFPLNLGLVLLFTFVMGVIIAPALLLAERNQPGVVLQAGILTLTTFGVLTGYAFLSRRDFSAWGSFLVTGLWVLIATSLLNLYFRNETAGLWLAGVSVFLFSGLLIFDTWRLRNVYGPDDYVMAAVAIYLDLLNIFMAILRLLGGRRG